MLHHPSETLGLVIVDHGSKRPAANDMLLDVAAMFKRVSGTPIVEPAHMELAEPTIGQAFDKCVAQGATLVIVHPYFLSPGRHSTTDIPHLTAAAAARHPGVKFHVTQPLGLDEKIAHIMIERIAHCVTHQFNCDYCRETGCCNGGLMQTAASTH
ncbi:MAG TPA: CbiX/SirB N-terminal domain-containing protein [Phycisphaerae bacterium]|nr:CbiX/SirB N-terminal domain-containing protein [Phycisphaerae bacterium]